MESSPSHAVQLPAFALLGAEPFRAAMEFARHHLTKANPSKPGDGHPVVIFPGLGADGSSVATPDPALRQRLRTPPPLRTTSIYSCTDGVVAWQACRHQTCSALVQDIEVDGSHIGMGWNREVLDAVTGQPELAPQESRPLRLIHSRSRNAQ